MFTNKAYILISFLLCLNVFSYGQSVTKNDSLILILKQLNFKKESHYLELGETGLTKNLSTTGG